MTEWFYGKRKKYYNTVCPSDPLKIFYKGIDLNNQYTEGPFT